MGRKKITPEQLTKEIKKILNQYGEITWSNVDEAAKKVAKKARTAVANNSRQFNSRWGENVYASGWRVKEDRGLWWSSYIVHQSKVPTETHLLEYGHELTPGVPMHNRDGEFIGINHASRAKAYPHIAPVAQKVPEDMEQEVLNAIRRSN